MGWDVRREEIVESHPCFYNAQTPVGERSSGKMVKVSRILELIQRRFQEGNEYQYCAYLMDSRYLHRGRGRDGLEMGSRDISENRSGISRQL